MTSSLSRAYSVFFAQELDITQLVFNLTAIKKSKAILLVFRGTPKRPSKRSLFRQELEARVFITSAFVSMPEAPRPKYHIPSSDVLPDLFCADAEPLLARGQKQKSASKPTRLNPTYLCSAGQAHMLVDTTRRFRRVSCLSPGSFEITARVRNLGRTTEYYFLLLLLCHVLSVHFSQHYVLEAQTGNLTPRAACPRVLIEKEAWWTPSRLVLPSCRLV